MSTEIKTIQTFRGPLALLQFAGPDAAGVCVQLTQGAGGGPDRPGFVQLSRDDAVRLIMNLQNWIIRTSDQDEFLR